MPDEERPEKKTDRRRPPLVPERAVRALDEHAIEWVEPLRQAAAGAVTNLSLSEVVRAALTSVAETLEADAASILIADDAGSALVARTSVGLVVEVDLEVRVPHGEGFAGKILASGKPLVVDDLDAFEVRSPVLRESSLKSIAGVPLLAGERTVGVMHISSKTPRHFTEDEVSLLEQVSYPVAAAIERVRLFEIERSLRRAAELTARRLEALQEMTAALLDVTDLSAVCRTIVDKALAGQREGEAGIWILQGGRLVRAAGGPHSEGFEEIPLDPSLPALENLESGEPLFVETRAELVGRWPVLAGEPTQAFAGFALIAGEKRLGVMAIAYLEEHTFDPDERAYLIAVAEQASLALDRAQAAQAERAALERRSFLAETSLALTNRYASPEQLLANLARLAVPRLADWCTVIGLRGERLERLAVAHHLPGLKKGLGAGVASTPVTDEVGIFQRVMATGEPYIFQLPAGERLDLGPLAETIGLTSTMVVPLEGHGRAIGIMAFVACGIHPAYTSEDLELAEELAARAGQFIEDLTQRARERDLAERLTRALLPTRLPRLEGVELAARYLPAEAGPVGGDWYDAFELPDRRLALVVGDVGGHGVEAASSMGRLRNGLFAFASEGHGPAVTLERMSDLLSNDSQEWAVPDPIVSISFGALDRQSLVLQTSCAGHPPWLHVRDGVATPKECGGRVLAAHLPAVVAESDHQLDEGDLCLFMTDGLIERPSELFDESLGRLAAAVEAHAEEPIDELADALIAETLPPGGRTDDCCLLAVRITARAAN